MNRFRILAAALLAMSLAFASGCSEEPADPAAAGVGTEPVNPADPPMNRTGADQAPATPEGTVKRVFAVQGMHCDGCVQAITAKLSAMPGVDSVVVSLDDESATVMCQPGAAAPDQIVKAVESLGYQAEVADP